MPEDGTHKADLSGYFQQTQTTLFDRLNEQAVHWKIYFHDIPQTTVLDNQRQPHNMARYFYIDKFFADARGPESEFPQYCLIEPDFMGYGLNDAHPPHDIMRAEKLIADVYNALRANQDLWNSTLLIVMFDEHGGFFDHVVPPAAVPPDDAKPSEYAFNQFGVRVPALLISPWTKARVEHTVFDHTSVLAYLTQKWGLGPLGKRVEAANSIGLALSTSREDGAPVRIGLIAEQLDPPNPVAEEEAFGNLNVHQSALIQLANWLEVEAVENAPKMASMWARVAEGMKTFANKILDNAFDVSKKFSVSLAEPDKLSLPDRTTATDKVAEFLMRQKRYAAAGIQNRLETAGLPAHQQQHSLQTLALITGRNFHREGEGGLDNAKAWVSKLPNPPR
jgi:hypothetical protein